VLEVNADGAVTRWYVEPTGRVLRSVTRSGAPMPGEMITDFSDWKAFSGLNLPTVVIVTRDGQKVAEMRLSGVELNPAVEANAFVKP
jgi:hypothetical protein